MNERILLIDDEPGAALTVCDRLKSEGYLVEIAHDGRGGEERARNGNFGLILLDIILPDKDGIAICRDLRARGIETPIIMVSAKGEIPDKVVGLRTGADDYLTKPFSPEELIARIEAVIRRRQVNADSSPRPAYSFGPFLLDADRGELYRNSLPVALSSLEYQLLLYLLNHRNQVCSRETLLDAVWGYNAFPTTRTVDVHIARLRQKLDDLGPCPIYIKTITKQGYRFIG